MGAENERDPATEPDDEPRGALQRAGAGGLEGGRGGGGGEDPPAKRHTYCIYIYMQSTPDIQYMVNICCSVCKVI